jgi:hypothetical protein
MLNSEIPKTTAFLPYTEIQKIHTSSAFFHVIVAGDHDIFPV